MVIRDERGVERLLAKFDRMKDLEHAYESGLAIFNDEKQQFERLLDFRPGQLHPDGRPFRVGEYYYFIVSDETETPSVRVKADWRAVQDPGAYEAFTGRGWERGAKPHAKGCWRDIETGQPIDAFAGSVYWNPYRHRWIAIVQKNRGEVWYAEADTPTGPWVCARRVARHDHYTYYWPGQDPWFDQDGGRTIYFEGTYTDSFSDAKVKTPRYNYNQIMYRLRLDDPRLLLPAPVYRVDGGWLMREDVEERHAWSRVQEIPFFAFAPDRRPPGMSLVAVNGVGRKAVFYAMSPRAGNTAGMVAVKDEAGRTGSRGRILARG